MTPSQGKKIPRDTKFKKQLETVLSLVPNEGKIGFCCLDISARDSLAIKVIQINAI